MTVDCLLDLSPLRVAAAVAELVEINPPRGGDEFDPPRADDEFGWRAGAGLDRTIRDTHPTSQEA